MSYKLFKGSAGRPESRPEAKFGQDEVEK